MSRSTDRRTRHSAASQKPVASFNDAEALWQVFLSFVAAAIGSAIGAYLFHTFPG